jgi:hypothetical protein
MVSTVAIIAAAINFNGIVNLLFERSAIAASLQWMRMRF